MKEWKEGRKEEKAPIRKIEKMNYLRKKERKKDWVERKEERNISKRDQQSNNGNERTVVNLESVLNSPVNLRQI